MTPLVPRSFVTPSWHTNKSSHEYITHSNWSNFVTSTSSSWGKANLITSLAPPHTRSSFSPTKKYSLYLDTYTWSVLCLGYERDCIRLKEPYRLPQDTRRRRSSVLIRRGSIHYNNLMPCCRLHLNLYESIYRPESIPSAHPPWHQYQSQILHQGFFLEYRYEVSSGLIIVEFLPQEVNDGRRMK